MITVFAPIYANIAPFPADIPAFTVFSPGAYTTGTGFPITVGGVITNYATQMTLHGTGYNDIGIRGMPMTGNYGKVLILQLWVKLGTATSLAIVPENGAWNSIAGAKTYTSVDGLNTTTYTLITHTFTMPAVNTLNINLGANGQGVTQSTGTVFAYGFQLRVKDQPPISASIFGNVGINTKSPTSMLHVMGTGNITGNTTVGGSLTSTGILTASSNATVAGSLTSTGLRTASGNLKVVGSTTLAGNVGIGTTAPTSA